MVHRDGEGVWFPRALHRRLEHEPFVTPEAARPVVERPRDPPPLRSAQRLLLLCLRRKYLLLGRKSAAGGLVGATGNDPKISLGSSDI